MLAYVFVEPRGIGFLLKLVVSCPMYMQETELDFFVKAEYVTC